MGDLRATYRFLASALRGAGYRVAATDLRGHGESDASFAAYGDTETAASTGPHRGARRSRGHRRELDGRRGCVIVAAERPDLVNGLVLVGPFVRNGSMSVIQRVLFRVAMAPLWAASAWKSYLPKLYAGRRPDDFDAYRQR